MNSGVISAWMYFSRALFLFLHQEFAMQTIFRKAELKDRLEVVSRICTPVLMRICEQQVEYHNHHAVVADQTSKATLLLSSSGRWYEVSVEGNPFSPHDYLKDVGDWSKYSYENVLIRVFLAVNTVLERPPVDETCLGGDAPLVITSKLLAVQGVLNVMLADTFRESAFV